MMTLMPDDLHERDILLWSEYQVSLLRRVAAGEQVNGVDWDHVIEEIADVGGSQLTAVHSLLRQAMIHLVKLHLSPRDTAREHWRGEIEAFIDAADDRYLLSMAQRIDLDGVWTRARGRVAKSFPNDPEVTGLPRPCPWTLDDLLAGDIDALLAALANAHLANPAGTP